MNESLDDSNSTKDSSITVTELQNEKRSTEEVVNFTSNVDYPNHTEASGPNMSDNSSLPEDENIRKISDFDMDDDSLLSEDENLIETPNFLSNSSIDDISLISKDESDMKTFNPLDIHLSINTKLMEVFNSRIDDTPSTSKVETKECFDPPKEFEKNRDIQSLTHANKCDREDCQVKDCREMKNIIFHVKICKQEEDCIECGKFFALCHDHAKQCKKFTCDLPFCLTLKFQWMYEQLNSLLQRENLSRRVSRSSFKKFVKPKRSLSRSPKIRAFRTTTLIHEEIIPSEKGNVNGKWKEQKIPKRRRSNNSNSRRRFPISDQKMQMELEKHDGTANHFIGELQSHSKSNVHQEVINCLKNPLNCYQRMLVFTLIKENPFLLSFFVNSKDYSDALDSSTQNRESTNADTSDPTMDNNNLSTSKDEKSAQDNYNARAINFVHSLIHANGCTNTNCLFENCDKMKRVVYHIKMCNQNCTVCQTTHQTLCCHAEHCQKLECSLPYVMIMKLKIDNQKVNSQQPQRHMNESNTRSYNNGSNTTSLLVPERCDRTTNCCT